MLWLRDKSKPRLGLLKPYPGQLFYPCNVEEEDLAWISRINRKSLRGNEEESFNAKDIRHMEADVV